jgi:hypothetical protein
MEKQMTEMTYQEGISKNPVRVTIVWWKLGTFAKIKDGALAASITNFASIEVLWVDWP